MQILQHLNRGYFILHPLKKSHKYYKVINILWKEPLPASSCNAHHLILHCFLPTAPPPRTWCRWLQQERRVVQQEGKSTLRTFAACIWDKAVLNVNEIFPVVVAQLRQLSHMQYLLACASRFLYWCEHLNRGSDLRTKTTTPRLFGGSKQTWSEPTTWCTLQFGAKRFPEAVKALHSGVR